MNEQRKNDGNFGIKLDQIIDYNKSQDKMIKEIHTVIHGNGNPETGLIVKTTRMSEKLNSITTTMKIHWALIIIVIGIAIKTAFF